MKPVILLVCAVLVSSGPHQALADPDPLALAIRQGLNSVLVDYPSAKFSDAHTVSFADDKQTIWMGVCGNINAKNRMGGYNGWREFYWITALNNNAGTLFTEGDTEGDLRAIADICRPERLGRNDITTLVAYQP